MSGGRGRRYDVPGSPPARHGGGSDHGMVTLEVALAIPVVLIVTVAATLLLSLGHLQARLTDAARSAARDVARGQSQELAVAHATRGVPGARVEVTVSGDVVSVRAEQEVRGPGPLLAAIRRTVSATVVTHREGTP